MSDVCQPWVFTPVLIGVVLMILQQFSGLNALSFNAAEIFRLANFNFDRLIGVVLINIAQVLLQLFVLGILDSHRYPLCYRF